MSLLRASDLAELSTGRPLLRARAVAFAVGTVLTAGGSLAAPAAWTSVAGASSVPMGSPVGTIVEYKLPSAVSTPSGIATGPDGNVWFTTEHGGMVGKIAPSGAVELFPVAPAAGSLGGIATGPDGNIWFTDYTDARVGRLSPAGTNLALFPVAGTPGLAGITAGPDGNMWFSEAQASMLGRISTGGTGYTGFSTLTAGAWPHGLGSGPDGNVWFAEIKAGKVGRITPSGGVSEWILPTVKAEPRVITTGADGNLWFTEFAGNKIGRITPTGAVTEFPVPTTASSPVGIAQGQDGYIWFTEQAGDKIGRISMSGVVSEFPLPTAAAQPDKIVLGADGNLWFTERTVNKIGTIVSGVPAGVGPKNTIAPTVSGVSAQGQVLHATQGSWSGLPVPSVSYQWSRCDQAGANCASIQGATSAVYTLGAPDVAMRVSVQVTAQNSSGTASAYSAVSSIVAGPPVAASEVVSGAAVAGQTLTVVSGAWGGFPAPELSYQWLRCDQTGGACAPIVGATGGGYVLSAEDVGGTLRVSATGTNTSGTATSASPQTPVINELPEPPVPAIPTVSGMAVEGQTLTVVPGPWGGFPAPELSYQWFRCDQLGGCTTIPGATSSTYVLEPADIGEILEVTVTGVNPSGTAVSVPGASAVVVSPPAPTGRPTLTGTAAAGEVLTAEPGVWGGYPTPELSYQWLRCDQLGGGCAPIPGAGAGSYVPRAADVGETLEVSVIGVNAGGTATATSDISSRVAGPPSSTVPVISGEAVEGQTLIAFPGAWGGYPTPELSYQWLRCDQTGGACAPIVGASAGVYVLSAADVGGTLRVSATGTNTSGTTNATSSASAAVLSAAGPLTGVLDSFNRANNAGPPSGSWTHAGVLNSTAKSNLYVIGNQATGASGTDTDFWNANSLGSNGEAFVTVAATPTANGDFVALGLRAQNPAASNMSAYQGFYVHGTSVPDEYKIVLRTNGTSDTALVSTTAGPRLAPNDKLLFRAIGNTLELWVYDGGAWARVLSAKSTAISSGGYAILTARNSVVRLDDFGGGTLP